MKTILAILAAILILGSTAASAQLYRTAYFMEGSTMRNSLNPAFRPYRGYVNIPVAGNITMNYTSDHLTYQDIFYPVGGKLVSLLDKNVSWAQISERLGKTNGINVDVSTTLLGFGFYVGRGLVSFSTDLKVDAGFKLPKEFFEFVKEGSGSTGSYDMRNLTIGSTAHISASLGYSYKLFENLNIGARINFLGGLARANVNFDKLDLTLNENRWAVDAVGNIDVAMKGLEVKDKIEDGVTYLDLESINFDLSKMRGLAGQGLSFDLGAEYKIIDRIKVSASVLNVGFMSWNKSATTRGISSEYWEFTGVDVSPGSESNTGTQREFKPDFERGESKSVKQDIFATVVLGAELDIFGTDILGLGVVFTHKKTEFISRSEFSTSLTFRPANWVTMAASYAFQDYSAPNSGAFNTLGFAVNFHPRWINFFLGTDFMITKVNRQFIPLNQRAMNLYMGIAVPLGREKPRNLPKLGI